MKRHNWMLRTRMLRARRRSKLETSPSKTQTYIALGSLVVSAFAAVVTAAQTYFLLNERLTPYKAIIYSTELESFKSVLSSAYKAINRAEEANDKRFDVLVSLELRKELNKKIGNKIREDAQSDYEISLKELGDSISEFQSAQIVNKQFSDDKTSILMDELSQQFLDVRTCMITAYSRLSPVGAFCESEDMDERLKKIRKKIDLLGNLFTKRLPGLHGEIELQENAISLSRS